MVLWKSFKVVWMVVILQLCMHLIFTQNQYQVVTKYTLPIKVQNISKLESLNNQTLVVNSAVNNQTCTQIVRYFQGVSFNQLTKQICLKYNENQSIKQTKYGIFTNKNQKLTFQSMKPPVDKQIYPQILFYSDFLITQQYIFVQDLDISPRLLKIDLNNFTATMHVIQDSGNCSGNCGNYKGVLTQIQGSPNEIAYGSRYRLYILDKQTLQIKEKLDQRLKYQDTDFDKIWSYYDDKKHKSVIVVKGSTYKYETVSKTLFATTNYQLNQNLKIRKQQPHSKPNYQQNNQKYAQSGRFYTQSYDIKIINQNQAYSFESNYVYKWNRIQDQILYLTYQYSAEESLYSSSILGVLEDETSFLMLRSSTYLQYWSILNIDPQTKNCRIIKIDSLNLKQDIDIQGSISSSQQLFMYYSSFSQTVGLVQIVGHSSLRTIAKIKSSVTNQSILGYGLFNSEYNEFLTLFQRNKTVNSTAVRQNFIQIRSLDDPIKVVKEVPINKPEFDNVQRYKLITHKNWGLNFLLMYKTPQFSDSAITTICKLITSQGQNSSYSITCQSSNDSTSSKISFLNYYTTSKYIISTITSQTWMSVFQIDFINSKITLIEQVKFSSSVQIIGQKQKVITSQYSQINVFDFNKTVVGVEKDDVKSQENKFWVGRFHRQYWQQVNFKGVNGFILPNKGLLYVYTDYSGGTDRPIKVIYDINNPPVTQKHKFYLQNQKILVFSSPIYIKSYITARSTCQDHVFYSSITFFPEQPLYKYSLYLKKFHNCPPFTKNQFFFLQQFQRQPTSCNIFESSNQKFLIIRYNNQFIRNQFVIEIRLIQQPQIIIYKNELRLENGADNVDITKDGLLVISGSKGIKILSIPIQVKPEGFGIQGISKFDVGVDKESNKTCLVFGGIQRVTTQENIELKHSDKTTVSQTVSTLIYLKKNLTSTLLLEQLYPKQQFLKLRLENQILYKNTKSTQNLSLSSPSASQFPSLILNFNCTKLLTITTQPNTTESNPQKKYIKLWQIQQKEKQFKLINEYQTEQQILDINFIQEQRKDNLTKVSLLLEEQLYARIIVLNFTEEKGFQNTEQEKGEIMIKVSNNDNWELLTRHKGILQQNMRVSLNQQNNRYVFSPFGPEFIFFSYTSKFVRMFNLSSPNLNVWPGYDQIAVIQIHFNNQKALQTHNKNSILKVEKDQQRSHKLANEPKIVDVSFQSNYQFLVIDSQGIIYKIAKTYCPIQKNFILTNGNCICKKGYYFLNSTDQQAVIQGQCRECSQFCVQCNQGGIFNCSQYSSSFYLLLGGIVLFVLLIPIVITIVLVKRKKICIKKNNSDLQEGLNQNGDENEQESPTENQIQKLDTKTNIKQKNIQKSQQSQQSSLMSSNYKK